MNESAGHGVSSGNDGISFAERKRRARAVKARPRRKAGGGGVRPGEGAKAHTDPLASQNFPEKEVALAAPVPPLPSEPPETAIIPVISPAPELTQEEIWRSRGEFPATIYCRPLNPRLLLIRTESGENGRVAVQPAMQLKFGSGRVIWVKAGRKPGFYELAGKYSMWGSRCDD